MSEVVCVAPSALCGAIRRIAQLKGARGLWLSQCRYQRCFGAPRLSMT